jgi:hypothetical protein
VNDGVARSCRLYRLIARAFPHRFRVVCGDGLEQLGADIVPLVWQTEGTLGLLRCFADLALRLPLELRPKAWASRARSKPLPSLNASLLTHTSPHK